MKLDNTRALQFYQIIRFLAVFTIGMAMVKLSLPQAQVGQYEVVLFIASLLTTFWITGIIQALLPMTSSSVSRDSGSKRPEIFCALVVVVALTLVSALLLLVFKNLIGQLAGVANFPYFKQTILYIMLSTPTLLIEYIYLIENQPRKMIAYGLIAYSLQVAMVVLPLLVDVRVELCIFGLIGISAIRMVWLLVVVRRYAELKIDRKFMFDFIAKSTPLSLKYLVSSSGLYIDQLIISAYYDSSTFAAYRFGAREIPLITILTVGLSNSMLVEFGVKEHIGDTLERLRRESLKLMHILFPLSVVAIILSKPLFPVIFSSDYLQSANIFMLYALLVTSRTIFPQTVTMGFQQNRFALLASTLEMVLNIALSLIFIQLFGIEGVALATVVVYLFEKVLLAGYNGRRLGIHPAEYIPMKPYTAYCTLTIATYLLVRFV